MPEIADYRTRRVPVEFDVLDDTQRLQVACEQLAQDWTQQATDERVTGEAAAMCTEHAEQLRQTLRSHT